MAKLDDFSDVKSIAILGLGMIGGSLAAALKKRGYQGKISAWGRQRSNLSKGLEAGIVDTISEDIAAVAVTADIIVIATPTIVAENLFPILKQLELHDAYVTDVASVKGNLRAAAVDCFGAMPSNLVLGHPIAGSEQSGVQAANPDLYVDHRVILTPEPTTDDNATNVIAAMWRFAGGSVETMSVAEHDQLLAATSHLPHVLAYSLVDTLGALDSHDDIFKFAAGGFRDFSRIASSDPNMWQEICVANNTAIVALLEQFEANLSAIKQAVQAKDSESLQKIFTRAKQHRDHYLALHKGDSKL